MDVTRPSRKLTARAAHDAVRGAVMRAEELGVAVNACVVDVGGRDIAFLRGDGAFLPSGQIARDKTYTAVGFGCRPAIFMRRCPASRRGCRG